MSDAPVLLPVGDLAPHPDNPRITRREDVIDRIAARIRDAGLFPPEHALLVRPVEGDRPYQIIAGHHRAEAAWRAGVTEVPCWVRELDDEAAYLALVTSNEQSELDPLEIGLHVFRWVALGDHGRGLNGGLSEYARSIGRNQGGLSKLRQAAETWTVLRDIAADENHESTHDFPDGSLFGRSTHLAEVHGAPRETWLPLAAHLVKESWSVADTKAKVAKIREFTIPERWAFFLPLAEVAERHLATREFSPRTVNQLTAAAEEVRVIPGAGSSWGQPPAGRSVLASHAPGRGCEPAPVSHVGPNGDQPDDPWSPPGEPPVPGEPDPWVPNPNDHMTMTPRAAASPDAHLRVTVGSSCMAATAPDGPGPAAPPGPLSEPVERNRTWQPSTSPPTPGSTRKPATPSNTATTTSSSVTASSAAACSPTCPSTPKLPATRPPSSSPDPDPQPSRFWLILVDTDLWTRKRITNVQVVGGVL